MDPRGLHERSPLQQIEVLAHRQDLFLRLWVEEDRIAELIVAALVLLRQGDKNAPSCNLAARFLDRVCAEIKTPSQVHAMCERMEESDAEEFLDRLSLSSVSDGDLMAELISQAGDFARLPGGAWIGLAMTRRGAILFEDHPERKFRIDELVPLGIESDRVAARALLGSALDQDRLDEASRNSLLELFPNDSYFKSRI